MLLTLIICACILLWLYVGYPLSTQVLAYILRHNKKFQLADRPRVAVLILAFNERSVIEQKIQNTLALRYPPDKLSVHVIDSGSTDGMREVVEKYRSVGVQYLNQGVREGKASALHFGVQHVDSDLILATDANAYFAEDALEHLVAPFANPLVGGATAAMRQVAAVRGSMATASERYWIHERRIRTAEATFASVCNLSGEAALFRRTILQNLKLASWYAKGTADDLSLSIAVVRAGYRLAYVPQADVWEYAPRSYSDYFKQKVRIVVQTIQTTFSQMPRLMATPGWYAYWVFPSRKVLPLLSPFALALFALSLGAVAWPGLALVAALTMGWVGLSLLVPRNSLLRALRQTVSLFVLLNIAVFLGWMQFFIGKDYTMWDAAKSTRA